VADLYSVLADLRTVFEQDEAALPLGTKRQWKSGAVIKTKKGWQPVPGSSQTPSEPEKKSQGVSYKQALSLWSKYQAPEYGLPPMPGALAVPKPGDHWKERKHEPRSSKEKYWKRGRPTEERRKLHREILTSFLQHVPSVPEGQKPVAVMMMGGPASGKGSISGVIPDDTFVKVDADRIKEMLPEYQEMVAAGDRNAAAYAHEESGYLASKLRDIARKQRQNMVLDGTGKYVGSYAHRMKQLQDDGYHVQLMMPDLDVDTAVERSQKRGEETGRWVPEKVVRQNYAVIPGNFLQISKAADSAMLYDNRGEFPRLVWSQRGGAEQTSDEDFMTRFREKHAPKPRRPRRGGEGEGQVDHVIRAFADMRALMHEDEHATAVDPMDLAKQAAAKLKDAPKPEAGPKFSEGEGLVLPEPDDSAMADVED
jgi:predicted ABC-type ATPase